MPPQLHRELLCHLCNESLDRDPLRSLLSARMENAEGVKKEMREAAAGDKGKIKARWLSCSPLHPPPLKQLCPCLPLGTEV